MIVAFWRGEGSISEKGYSSEVWLYGGELVHEGSPWCLWGKPLEIHLEGVGHFFVFYQI